MAGLDRGGRRGEHDRAFLEQPAHHRDIARVIMDALLLLEARFVRLVDDDQPEIGIGQEQRRARADRPQRSEEHTSELQSLMRISYAVFCLKNKKSNIPYKTDRITSNNIIQSQKEARVTTTIITR